MKLGQVAPFEGVLLSPVLAAEYFVSDKSCQDSCDAKTTLALNLSKARSDAELSVWKDKFSILKDTDAKILDAKEQRIKFLSALEEPPKWYQSNTFLIGTGFAGGVATAIAIVYSLNRAAK